ncbi:MAG: RelA/SpoT family protein, partial [Clostridia bacterium]|nr:RelA/SpoT family protein [Clostridia bacterium]
MSKIKWELEDIALRYIDPVGYYEIVDKIAQKRSEREQFIDKIIEILKKKLSDVLDTPPIIEGRAKHFYSIYRKMFMQNKTIDEIYDLFAVRVIVDTVAECYAVLGTVHELFKPVPGRFKDYIAMPKPNMYQSLHSTLIGPGGTPFEIQIRTKEMHHTAENGIAAHWKYKEGVSGSTDMDEKLEWIKQLLEIQKENNAEEFMQALKIDMFSDEVFVFTPKGDVVSLPINATPIDFAYSIHSAVGNRMTGAKVNGKIVTLDYTLKNGDIVEVITSNTSSGPNLDWIKICKTSQARNKINQWFKKVNREENIEKGREILEHELKKNSLPVSFMEDKELIQGLIRKYGFNNVDDLLAAIGYGSSNAARFVTRFKTECKKKFAAENTHTAAELIPVLARPHGETNNSGVIVEGIDNCLIRFSHCCNPVPGDEIVGYVTRGRGVAIHRADCINMLNALNNEQESARFIKVRWAEDTQANFLSTLTVTAGNRSNLLLDIMAAVAELKLTATNVNARTGKNNLAIIEITMEIADTEQLNTIIKKIKRVDGVLSIVRRRQ